MIVLGDRAQRLPAPPRIVWRSLVDPHEPGCRPWLRLLADEVEPVVVRAEEPHSVTWTSLWPSRPNQVIDFEITPHDRETLLRFVLSTPDAAPDPSKVGHLRKRLNHLLFADLRFSYGQ